MEEGQMDPEDQQGAHDSQAEAGARLGSAVERERAGQGIRHQPGCLGEVATSFHEGLGDRWGHLVLQGPISADESAVDLC